MELRFIQRFKIVETQRGEELQKTRFMELFLQSRADPNDPWIDIPFVVDDVSADITKQVMEDFQDLKSVEHAKKMKDWVDTQKDIKAKREARKKARNN